MGQDRTSSWQPVRAALALLCLGAWCSGCDAEDDVAVDDPDCVDSCPPNPDAAGTLGPIPIPGCEMLDVTPCDVRVPDCQLSRLELAACLRETQALGLPRVTIMTEQAYVDQMNARNETMRLSGTNHFEVAMTWLGLAQPGTFSLVPLTTESIANWFGTYRWRERDLLVIDHEKPADDAASNVALVAALIRSLRDRDIDIRIWASTTSIDDEDSRWGGDALYFGEARFYSNRYKAALEGIDPSSFDELGQINAGIRDDIAWIRAQPSPYVATNDRFPGNFGARRVYLAWKNGGVAAVDNEYATTLFTHQLMASETEEGAAPALKYHNSPTPPSEWKEHPVTGLGAWGLFLSLSRHMPTEAAWSLSRSWRGDQIHLYQWPEPHQQTALVWQIETADEASAALLESELTADAPNVQIRRVETFVTLAVSTTEGPLDWAFVAD